MTKKKALSLITGGAVSAAAFYFAIRNVPATDLIAYMTEVNYVWILPTVLLIAGSFVVKAYRWQILLGAGDKVRLRQAYHPMMIGFMINCILPGRVGEVARPIVLRQQTGVPFTTGIATLAAERIFDIFLLLGLFAGVMAKVEIDPGLSVALPEWAGSYRLTNAELMAAFDGILKLSLVLMAGILMVGFDASRKWVNAAISAAPSVLFFTGGTVREKIRQKVCLPMTGLVENFAVGFAQMKNPKTLLLCVCLSIAAWIMGAGSFYTMSLGCPGIGLGFAEIAATLVIVCFFIALPSVPGYWGIWEAGGVFALYLFGVAGKDAAGYTLVNHAVQIVSTVALGVVSAMITGINILSVTE
jgi:uncharacterized membrane protein YbhN (UPF0104 family)